jgi:hypothetical protein
MRLRLKHCKTKKNSGIANQMTPQHPKHHDQVFPVTPQPYLENANVNVRSMLKKRTILQTETQRVVRNNLILTPLP